MRFLSAFLVICLLGCSSAGLLKNGNEYEYKATIKNFAGTMDVATHTSGEMYRMKVRLQVVKKTLNVEISDMEHTMYVGGHLPTEDPYAKTNFERVPRTVAFSVTQDSDGLFKSLTMPAGLTVFEQNMAKGLAGQLQVNSGEMKMGKLAFKSKEKSLHGECEYSYAVSPDLIVKSVSHMADCKNRNFKFIDDWRGHRCDIDFADPQKKTSTDGLFSYANTAYMLGEMGGTPVIKGMSTTSSLVSQMYETEGMSHMAVVNLTMILVDVRSSPGDISVSGNTVTTLDYDFADASYKWNEDRNLKGSEPFLSGQMFEDDQATLKAAVLTQLDNIAESLHAHGNDPETVQKAHKHGLDGTYYPLFGMDYATLKATALELLADKSETGVEKSNMFNEYLANAGTSAAAMVIKDLIMENKLDNDRDAARMLTSVPYKIRRPNTQLVREFEKLLNFGGAKRFLKMAIPLAFSHLVHITCVRAGPTGSPAQQECWNSFASRYVTDFWQKYKTGADRDEKHLALEALHNIRFGGQAKKLKDLVLGKTGEDPEFRVQAIWSAGWDAYMNGGVDYFMPVFANHADDHEVRMAALEVIFHLKPTTTDMARILTILKTETDYEVINMAYALFERFANTINPCLHDTAEKAKFFLKYMKQYSQYEVDWGFGVSKVFTREYQKKKYGYGGAYSYYVMGSHKSTTPLSLGMWIDTTFFHSYTASSLWVHLRIEGLAKGLIRKFKTMDPGTWKTEDLQKILTSDMNIRERPDQPVRVKIGITVKGIVMFSRCYDENSAKEGGKLNEFFKGFTDMGNEYKLNHQRIVQFGGVLYEQPSEIGLPIAYLSSSTVSAHLKATVKRGNHRGLIFRNLEYDINILGNGYQGMIVTNPVKKLHYSIMQHRIYHFHVPRKVVLGLNPIRKEIKVSISRPPYDDPAMALMHAQTYVQVAGNKVGCKKHVEALKGHCAQCEDTVIVSRGPDAAQKRVVRDYENQELGYYNHMEYFDCEMDIRQGNTVGRAIMAFLPYNKNPKSMGASISLGLRQIAAYIALYPRVERCGIYTRWSQSKTNPTTEYELSIRGSSEQKETRMFFRGRKTTIRAILKANGEPTTRAYRVSVTIESSPANIFNKIKVQMNRAPVDALNIKPYTVCMAYESKYPEFAKEFMAVDFNEKMTVSGKAMLQYGQGTECDQGDGEIRVNFNHETTEEGTKALKQKWYYKQCMEQKARPDWQARGGDKLPATEPCYMTLYDATNARHYHWEMEFVKLTNRMKNIIANARSIMQAGLWPYWDEDPDTGDDVNGNDIGPFINADVWFKNSDKNLDVRMETSQGVKEYNDYPLKLEWTNRLRNLRLTKMLKRLMDMKVIFPCVATVGMVQTNDNVTYPYNAGSCWTLTSGHCGPKPAYAVFSKKVGNKLAVRAYFGGHAVEIAPNGKVTIDGAAKNLREGKEEIHTHNDVEIFKIVKWGSAINIYSFLKVWVVTDNVFVQVIPAPSTRGQHCGLCGTFNRNMFDEWLGKDGQTIMPSSTALVNEWKWKC